MHAVEIPLSDILLPWLDVFHSCTTKWGLVTDVREDETTYKRHGIIVELSVNIADALAADSDTVEWKLRRIRQGIDLVKLTLAVDPHALMPLFSRKSLLLKDELRYGEWALDLEKEDLEAVTRGDAPFELRVILQFKTKLFCPLSRPLADTFMKKLDKEEVRASRNSPTFVRDYLLEHCKPSQYHRLLRVPVHAVLMVEPKGENACDVMIDEHKATRFFVACAQPVGELQVYQQSRRDKTWEIATHYAPLVVEKIDLRLVYVPLTRNVMNEITLLMYKGIPVSSSDFYLDLRFELGEEQYLQRFLDAIVAHEHDQIMISTGWVVPSDLKALDTNGQDFTTRITTVLRCIGRLNKEIQFTIGCLFELFKDSINRLAIIRGLVAFLLTRSRPIHLDFDDYELREHDAVFITECARSWKRRHPGTKLRLQHLASNIEGESNDAICALLRALDDVEEVTLYPHHLPFTTQDVETMLRYPSLRCLYLERVQIESMAIFDTLAGVESQRALERLELSTLTVTDPASLTQFIKRLDPYDPTASVLSGSLHTLSIAENDASPRRVTTSERRAINDPAAMIALEQVLATNQTLRYVNFLRSGTLLADDDIKPPPRRSVLPAPAEIRRSPIMKARMTAFLSVIRDCCDGNLQSLDSNVVKLIFAYATPTVYRRIWI